MHTIGEGDCKIGWYTGGEVDCEIDWCSGTVVLSPGDRITYAHLEDGWITVFEKI